MIIGKAENLIVGRVAVIKKISLAKFNEGGAAKFKARKINHQSEIAGIKERRPLMINIFRVWAII